MFANPLRPYLYGAAGIIGLLLLGWALRLDTLRADWREKFEGLTEQAAGVLTATRHASGNPKLKWEGAAGQIVALGEDHRNLLETLNSQNLQIDEMAREAVRLRARSSELRHIADRAQAQRAAALKRLSDMATTPGTREDCMTLLREAEDALDLIYEAGL